MRGKAECSDDVSGLAIRLEFVNANAPNDNFAELDNVVLDVATPEPSAFVLELSAMGLLWLKIGRRTKPMAF